MTSYHHTANKVVPQCSFLTLTATVWLLLPIQSSQRLKNQYLVTSRVSLHGTDAAARYRADLIKCCSTLTGLSVPTHFFLLPLACEWHLV